MQPPEIVASKSEFRSHVGDPFQINRAWTHISELGIKARTFESFNVWRNLDPPRVAITYDCPRAGYGCVPCQRAPTVPERQLLTIEKTR